MILDTCALLWLAADQSALSENTLTQIDQAPKLGISAISAFEIGQKYKRGQLKLSLPPMQWFERAIQKHRVTVIKPSVEICLCATELPDIHKDPFDRLIISTALLQQQTVVTTDTVFPLYGVETLS